MVNCFKQQSRKLKKGYSQDLVKQTVVLRRTPGVQETLEVDILTTPIVAEALRGTVVDSSTGPTMQECIYIYRENVWFVCITGNGGRSWSVTSQPRKNIFM